jgi:hypothetical protein
MLRGYFDESGAHHKNEGIFTLAGYVASAKQWRLFTRDWQRLLAESGFNSLPSTESPGRFHMHDFIHDRTWPESRKNDLLRDLAKIIKTRASFGVAFPVFVRDYNETIVQPAGRTPRKWEFRKPYVFAMRGCMEVFWENRRCLNRMPGEKIATYFDRTVEFEKPARKLFEYWASIATWGQIFGKVEFDERDIEVPLDAADLLAYAANVELRNRKTNGRKAPNSTLPLLYVPGRLRLSFQNKQTLTRLKKLLFEDGVRTGILDEQGQRTSKPLPEPSKPGRRQ